MSELENEVRAHPIFSLSNKNMEFTDDDGSLAIYVEPFGLTAKERQYEISGEFQIDFNGYSPVKIVERFLEYIELNVRKARKKDNQINPLNGEWFLDEETNHFFTYLFDNSQTEPPFRNSLLSHGINQFEIEISDGISTTACTYPLEEDFLSIVTHPYDDHSNLELWDPSLITEDDYSRVLIITADTFMEKDVQYSMPIDVFLGYTGETHD